MGSFRPCPPHPCPRHAPTEGVRCRVNLVSNRPNVMKSGVYGCVRSDLHHALITIALSGDDQLLNYHSVLRHAKEYSPRCPGNEHLHCAQVAAEQRRLVHWLLRHTAECGGTDPVNPRQRHVRADIERRLGAPSMTQVTMTYRAQSREH
jgi:hypothetical protein